MLIAVDKPKELSSFDIVKRLKHEFPWEKIGHSWTLDPKATGLMILWIWKDTKKLNELIGLDKKYEAVIDFSKKSDTRDMGWREYYEELSVDCHSSPSNDEVVNKLKSLIPSYELLLPNFSAKKIEGKRLYAMARKGKEIKEIKKLMKVNDFEILDYDFPVLKVRLDVGSGTYIRSIAHWLGEEFWVGGILTDLRRISVGKRELNEIEKSKGGEVDYHMRGQVGSFGWREVEI